MSDVIKLPFAIVSKELSDMVGKDDLSIHRTYETLAQARKDTVTLSPGTYSIIKVVEEDFTIEEVPASTRVVRGLPSTTRTRTNGD